MMDVEVVPSPDEVRQKVRSWQREGLTVGFVPTMGALHEAHCSLIRAAAAECDRTVVSIYVNPTQFGPGEDLGTYPRRLQQDCTAASEAGADLVFAPRDDIMYGEDYATYVEQERLTERLCGASRPGHFRGVLTVVCKLFNIVPAQRAYFGQKDFQQSVVIGRMVKDLNFAIEVRVLPTVREEDGLAMSSRNEYLSPQERKQARCLYRALMDALELYRSGERSAHLLIEKMRQIVAAEPDVRREYVEIVDCETLAPVERVDERSVAALAVRIGRTKLIDNMPFAGKTAPTSA